MDATRIRDTRLRLRLTQPQLGQLLGAHWVTVSRWERGEAAPSSFQLDLLAAFERSSRRDESAGIGAVLVAAGVVGALALLLGGSSSSRRPSRRRKAAGPS